MRAWFWPALVIMAIPYLMAMFATVLGLRVVPDDFKATFRKAMNYDKMFWGSFVWFVIGVPAVAALLGAIA